MYRVNVGEGMVLHWALEPQFEMNFRKYFQNSYDGVVSNESRVQKLSEETFSPQWEGVWLFRIFHSSP